MWDVDSTFIVPVVVTANDLKAMNLDKHLKRLVIHGCIKGLIPKAVFLDTVHIGRKFLCLKALLNWLLNWDINAYFVTIFESMENCAKVFSSNITRAESHCKNNLYDLLNIVPAKPLKLNYLHKYTCDFNPTTDKYYIPKRKSRLKVKTVRDIRESFEQDTYTYLFNDLETQHNALFKKISRGSSKDENTKILAKKLLKGDSPILRSTWQMLINLNPEQHPYPRQFVLWNGKYIQVNGSLGGRKRLIFNYDLAHKKKLPQNNKKISPKTNVFNKKKGLIRNSLAVKFKPGPLGRKTLLDDSHQKYHVGNIEVIDLPKPGLDIQPTYGTALESTITQFLNNYRNEDGTISRKWAEFAVSVLGTIESSNPVQLNKECVTFNLNYKYNQHRLLMRRDVDIFFNTSKPIQTDMRRTNPETDEHSLLPEIEYMMNKILDSVEISVMENTIFNAEPEWKEQSLENVGILDIPINLKDYKSKRKFCELGRLDVTVIRLPEAEDQVLTKSCGKMHCSLGCICASLECTYNLRQHCGRVECMFDCKCDFLKYKNDLSYAGCSELIPGLINLDNEINLKLAKEEQKFHQTVIVSGEKSILLKNNRRCGKTSKKYEDFLTSNTTLKNADEKKQILSIVAFKLNCDNIEPWCMVHKLYKCFCKCKFTENCASVSNEALTKESLPKETTTNNEGSLEKNTKLANDNNNLKESVMGRTRPERMNLVKRSKIYENSDKRPMSLNNNIDNQMKIDSVSVKDEVKTPEGFISENVNNLSKTRSASRTLHKQQNIQYNNDTDDDEHDIDSDYFDNEYKTKCSRTIGYNGRKYSDDHYTNTNRRISEMEKNDKRLQVRLTALYNNNDNKEEAVIKPTIQSPNDNKSLLKLLCDVDDMFSQSQNNDLTIPKSKTKSLTNESKLVAWLEANYKMYKRRKERGFNVNSLEAPKLGKVALHSWDFILTRYREKKNHFLISQQKPYRIFVAVHTKNQFFDNCINLNDIRFADLHKYPQTVQNLLINATDLKDYFCILRGLSCCWELIGSVTKVSNEEQEGTPVESELQTFFLSSDTSVQQTADICMAQEEPDEITLKSSNDAASSKWFVLIVENDFSEIRFYKRGFFVKYDSIVNAIKVARVSKKPVRLSSKKCIAACEMPQFGVYAIPNTNESCVFIGPYEINETLGVETIKKITDCRKLKKTRGFWITMNKVDNLKVVDDPLSFMPLTNSQKNKATPLENHISADEDENNTQELPEGSRLNKMEEAQECSPTKKEIKIVKPIKIRKINGFYHLASDGVLKKISLRYPQNVSNARPVILNSRVNIAGNTKKSLLKTNAVCTNMNRETIPATSHEEIVDSGPQIKIAAVFSTQNEDLPVKINKIQEKSMFILKPEEINRKLLQNKFSEATSTVPCANDKTPNNSMELGIQNTLTPVNDIYVISDDENDTFSESIYNDNHWNPVWIECTNTCNLGRIAGRRNSENLLSFKLPGREYSEFYTEKEAFAKINMELIETIGTSMHLKLQWKVTESSDDLQGHEMNLYADYEENALVSPSTSEDLRSDQSCDRSVFYVRSNSFEQDDVPSQSTVTSITEIDED